VDYTGTSVSEKNYRKQDMNVPGVQQKENEPGGMAVPVELIEKVS